MCPLLCVARDLVTKYMEEAEALDTFLASDFNGKICLQESQTRKRPAQDSGPRRIYTT